MPDPIERAFLQALTGVAREAAGALVEACLKVDVAGAPPSPMFRPLPVLGVTAPPPGPTKDAHFVVMADRKIKPVARVMRVEAERFVPGSDRAQVFSFNV